MKSLLSILLLVSVSLGAVEPVKPEDPKLFRQQDKIVEKDLKSLETLPVPTAPGLYRSWINPVKRVKNPANQALSMQLIKPSVRSPEHEQSFFKSKEWKPGKAPLLYEKSKDFDSILNPLSLKDFNRFIYQRNPSSP